MTIIAHMAHAADLRHHARRCPSCIGSFNETPSFGRARRRDDAARARRIRAGRLAHEAGRDHRAVRRRRRGRPPPACRRCEAFREMEAAGNRREQGRRIRQHRHGRRRACGAGRLYVRARAGRQSHRQSDPFQAPDVRHIQGPRARHGTRAIAERSRRASVGAREDVQGVDRVREGKPGQAQLRLARGRQRGASGRRVAENRRRDRHGARAVQGTRTRCQRSSGWQYAAHVRRHLDGDPVREKRQARCACDRESRALAGAARRADRRRKRLAGIRGDVVVRDRHARWHAACHHRESSARHGRSAPAG